MMIRNSPVDFLISIPSLFRIYLNSVTIFCDLSISLKNSSVRVNIVSNSIGVVSRG